MKVAGTIGLIGSGKDEVVDYLHERCGAACFSVGDIARNIAEAEGLDLSRENLHDISRRMFAKHGRDYFAQRTIERIEAARVEVAAISGVRTPADARTLRDHFGDDFLLVHVAVTDPRTRWERVAARDDPRDPQSYAAFREQEAEEEELFHVKEACALADATINNDRSPEAFRRRIEERVVPEACGK